MGKNRQFTAAAVQTSFLPPVAANQGFSAECQAIMDRLTSLGRRGCQLDERGYSGSTFQLETGMQTDTLALGEGMRQLPGVNPNAWALWMRDAEVLEGFEFVTVYHRSQFFCDGVRNRFGSQLQMHFSKPIRYQVSQTIHDRVGKRTAAAA